MPYWLYVDVFSVFPACLLLLSYISGVQVLD